METMKIQRLRPGAQLPQRATGGSAGYDLCALVEQPTRVEQGQITKIPTGLAFEIPPGHVGLLFGRSGHGAKHGVTMANAVGVIDSDYRGEVSAFLTCCKAEGYTVQPGERIAQLVLLPIATPALELAETLEETDRGAGGFGSTGRV